MSIDNNREQTVAAGDTIQFTVTTQIPAYASNYIKPVFRISDELSAGLSFKELKSVSVNGTAIEESGNYTFSPGNADADGNRHSFSLSFTEAFLGTLTGQSAPVTIVYEADVTSAADHSVNPEENTVTLNYSTEPWDTEGHGKKKARTNHYSFDIDADLLAQYEYHATEVVKVGVDSQGNEIKESRQLANGNWIGALKGAEFKLCLTSGDPYTNKYIDADTIFVSDEYGRLKQVINNEVSKYGIRGLDAGEYKLIETKAPAGYIKLQDAVSILIEVLEWENTDYTEPGNPPVTYQAKSLKKYSVKIAGHETARYTMINEAQADEGDTVVGKDGFMQSGDSIDTPRGYGKLANTKGTELPSTGGMGTELFYLIGILMTTLSSAGIVMKRKRKE